MKKLILLILVALLLTACQAKWQIDVDLTPEKRAEILAEIKEVKITIQEQIRETEKAGYMAYVNLARAYEKLGNLGTAIKIYTDAIADGMHSSAVYNNLGRLYEKVGEYDLAVEQYQILVDKFMENRYLYDITWAYIRAKDSKNAEKYFNAWQLETQATDENTQKAIRKLREEEKK